MGTTSRGWLARGVEKLFNGYRQPLGAVDTTLPARLASPRRVAVVGAGLAGITAAATLAERGFHVTLYERDPHFGGKLTAYRDRASDGRTVRVEHGFHAFFRHYYNQRRLFEKAGVLRSFKPIDEYRIVPCDGDEVSLRGPAHPPLLNLVALSRQGLYRVRDLAFSKSLHRLDPFLRYDEAKTFAQWDETSFESFSREAALPSRLLLVFNTFARAFFSDPDRLSLAELIKSFHFYYLSHDEGLLYDYVDGDYESKLLAPLRAYLERLSVTLRLGCGVSSLSRCAGPDGAKGIAVDGEPFDGVVLAANVPAVRSILLGSRALLDEDATLARRIERLREGQRYAVLRVWIEGQAPRGYPPFFVTERERFLDAVTLLDGVDPTLRHDSGDDDTFAVELHCYAVPDGPAEDEVREGMLRELEKRLPQLRGLRVRRHHLQLRRDFPAFHVGMHAERPTVETGVDGLVLAGDWVRLACPAMLMEAACTSGVLAANALCARASVRGEPVFTVPHQGLLART